MARGGRQLQRQTPWRRCLVSGKSGPTYGLIRFVIAPDGNVTPDLAERLPGRGAWITAQRHLVQEAMRRNAFARAAKRPDAHVHADLAEQIEDLLRQRLLLKLGLARRSGHIIAGFEQCQARLRQGPVGARLEAHDGTADGKRKLHRIQPDAPVVDCVLATELGTALGRGPTVHAVLEPDGITPQVLRDAHRLIGMRDTSVPPHPHGTATQTKKSVH